MTRVSEKWYDMTNKYKREIEYSRLFKKNNNSKHNV
jgi:hypothetical protein